MAHFAKLDQDNNVIWVTPVQDSICEDNEQKGIDYLTKVHNWPLWKKTSYNTIKGKHYTDGVLSADQTKAFRANFAGTGFVYDSVNDIFKEKDQPFPSWTMNNTTGRYEAPVPMPQLEVTLENAFKRYEWNENTQTWDLI